MQESAALAAAKVILNASFSMLKRMDIIESFIECTKFTLKDRKFWKVCLARLKIPLSFCNCTTISRDIEISNTAVQERSAAKEERQLMLEAIFLYKDTFLSIAKKSLTDNEVKVTASAT